MLYKYYMQEGICFANFEINEWICDVLHCSGQNVVQDQKLVVLQSYPLSFPCIVPNACCNHESCLLLK